MSEATATYSPDQRDRLEAQLFSVLESLRQVSTSSSEVALAASRFPELKELRDRLADVRSDLNDLVLSPPEDASAVEGWRRTLVELADDRDRLTRELRIELVKREVFTDTVTSESVAKGLEKGSVVVSFLRLRSTTCTSAASASSRVPTKTATRSASARPHRST